MSIASTAARVPAPRRWAQVRRLAGRRGTYLLLLPAVAYVVVFLVVPLVISGRESLGAGEFPSLEQYRHFLGSSVYVSILLQTLELSAISTVITLLVGYPLALALARTTGRRSIYLHVLVLSPILVSQSIIGYGWMLILGPGGMLSWILGSLGFDAQDTSLIFTKPAVVIGIVHVYLPFMVLALEAGLRGIDPDLVKAARNLGAGPVRAFLRVTLPMSLPGILGGVTIVYCLTMGTFAIPTFLGGTQVRVMSSLIYQNTIQFLNWPFASAMAFILLIVTVSVAATFNAVGDRTPWMRGLRRG